MSKFDHSFSGNILKIATLNHGVVRFIFGDAPVPELPEEPTEEEIAERDGIIQDNALRASVFDLITSDTAHLHEFVNLVGQDPNTGFINFINAHQ
jgi:hypothetical protein